MQGLIASYLPSRGTSNISAHIICLNGEIRKLFVEYPSNQDLYSSLKHQSQLQQTTIFLFYLFFCYFSEETTLDSSCKSSANKSWHFMWIIYLLGRWFTWNVKTCFLWKIKKKILNVVCYKLCLALWGLIIIKALSKLATDDILIFFFSIIFQRKLDFAFHVNHLTSR